MLQSVHVIDIQPFLHTFTHLNLDLTPPQPTVTCRDGIENPFADKNPTEIWKSFVKKIIFLQPEFVIQPSCLGRWSPVWEEGVQKLIIEKFGVKFLSIHISFINFHDLFSHLKLDRTKRQQPRNMNHFFCQTHNNKMLISNKHSCWVYFIDPTSEFHFWWYLEAHLIRFWYQMELNLVNRITICVRLWPRRQCSVQHSIKTVIISHVLLVVWFYSG